jgi:hypothetical protein
MDAQFTGAGKSLPIRVTNALQADRIETDHVIVYIDNGLLPADAEQSFARNIERVFVATSTLLRRGFNRASRRTPKATYYLTNRAGISHAEATRIFLYASRVIPSPTIAIHETVHLSDVLDLQADVTSAAAACTANRRTRAVPP